MIGKKSVSQEGFDALLEWLDGNREAAGEKYEKIRQRLIRIFAGRGCFEAEELADETINRVTLKLPQVIDGYSGEPISYFYGVANHIHQEWLRKQNRVNNQTHWEIADTDGKAVECRYECLESCLACLPEDERQIVVNYYRDEKKAKIENRRKLAAELEISITGLQVKVFRIRQDLQKCVQSCFDEKKS